MLAILRIFENPASFKENLFTIYNDQITINLTILCQFFGYRDPLKIYEAPKLCTVM